MQGTIRKERNKRDHAQDQTRGILLSSLWKLQMDKSGINIFLPVYKQNMVLQIAF